MLMVFNIVSQRLKMRSNTEVYVIVSLEYGEIQRTLYSCRIRDRFSHNFNTYPRHNDIVIYVGDRVPTLMKGNAMGVDISPEYIVRLCNPAPHKCGECGSLVWVDYREWCYSDPCCVSCGHEVYDVEFYPTEFEKVQGHLTYTTLFEIMGAMGLPKLYSGDVSTALVRSRLHFLEGHRHYEFIADMVESAEQHGVDIGFA